MAVVCGIRLFRRQSPSRRESRLYHFENARERGATRVDAGPTSLSVSESDYARAILEPILATRRMAREPDESHPVTARVVTSEPR